MTIELSGLVVFGHHGYLEEERRLGQRFLVDLWVDVRGEAAESDRIEDTVDYRRLATLVRETFAGPERLLLEGLAGAIADGIVDRFPTVERIAKLAHLELGPQEAEALARELGATLEYAKLLEQVDTRGIEPTAHVLPLATPLRADEPGAPLPLEAVLQNAPSPVGSAFGVPPVLGDEVEG